MNTPTTEKLLAEIYPVCVAFSRFHTRGILNGIETTDSIRFVSRERAASWIRGIRRNTRNGSLNYSISKVRVASNI